MGLPRKGSSKIIVGEDTYRWVVSPDSGIMYVAIQVESGEGSRILVPVGYESPVTPSVVRGMILKARQEGWDPHRVRKPGRKAPTRRRPEGTPKPPAVPKEDGWRCPVCTQDSLHFVRDGYFGCGSCGRTFVPEDLRKRLNP